MQVVGADGGVKTTALFVGAPAGVIQPYGGTTPPYGWLTCDGSAVSRTVYATLFAAIGTNFGIGDGSTTFNLPNLLNVSAETFDFRLTTQSGVAVSTSDRTSQGTLYLTPIGNGINGSTITAVGTAKISLYDGSRWNLYLSGELSLSLTLTSGNNYDVFVYDNSGTLTLETVIWTNNTTRATALDLQDGVLCKDGALTHRYVGTIRASGTNVIEDSIANRFVVNYYNRVLKNCESTDSSSRSITSSLTQVGSINFNYLVCVSDYAVKTEGQGIIESDSANHNVFIIVGSGTTTAATNAVKGLLDFNTGSFLVLTEITTVSEIPAAGLIQRYLLMQADSGTTATVRGDLSPSVLRAIIQC